ncbi:CPBP family intramembrane glutamic endopeptidase [Sphingomonas sp. S2-65]|uniref:CPBP family intramembrane glutamic endopeptidase n=1 Tax=Sphingomonas sp. S2-65 TaxID=2903960 RepID=UPI001F32384A|nr:CPBP family intramembrane glutamic endopeptidase [Sphingomonas sp. S2-65]UYY58073.1 CPBP family intramembrane metalloprotease [Sphingomonas sp. S2-65]
MILLLAVMLAILSLQSVVRSFTSNETVILAMAFLTVILAYGAYATLVQWGERRSPAELALGPLPRELAAGIAIGAAIMTATVGVLWLAGIYSIRATVWADWPHDVREALGTGLLEELLARLVIFRLLARAFRVDVALALSAALFGLAHLGNPGASLGSAAAIAVEAGLTFAGFYLLTGRIWMSVGAHAGWNFAQGAVLGASVSGMPSTGSLLTTTPLPHAAAWLSGGDFGPEASPVAVIIGLAVFLATMRLTQTHARCRTSDHAATGGISHRPSHS